MKRGEEGKGEKKRVSVESNGNKPPGSQRNGRLRHFKEAPPVRRKEEARRKTGKVRRKDVGPLQWPNAKSKPGGGLK